MKMESKVIIYDESVKIDWNDEDLKVLIKGEERKGMSCLGLKAEKYLK